MTIKESGNKLFTYGRSRHSTSSAPTVIAIPSLLIRATMSITHINTMSQKMPPYYFFNNSVKINRILIIFGTENPEEI